VQHSRKGVRIVEDLRARRRWRLFVDREEFGQVGHRVPHDYQGHFGCAGFDGCRIGLSSPHTCHGWVTYYPGNVSPS
jgi:hypothetical protein